MKAAAPGDLWMVWPTLLALCLVFLAAWLGGVPEARAQSCLTSTTVHFEDTTNTVGRDVVLADFDGDGDLDVAVARSFYPSVLYLNDGTGKFALSWTAAINESSLEAGAGDIDGYYGIDPLSCPNGDDCDDGEAMAFPIRPTAAMTEAQKQALDICDGLDNNCDGVVDGIYDPDRHACPDDSNDICGATDCGYEFACVCEGGGCECKEG